MRKSIFSLALAILLFQPRLPGSQRYNRSPQIVVASGTPVQLATTQTIVREVFIQMAVSASGGVGYVMAGIPNGVTPSSSTASQLTAQLCAATSTTPGCAYSDSNPLGIDVSQIWVDGGHTGDVIICSWDRMQP